MVQGANTKFQKIARSILIVLLVVFSLASVIFSLVVLFSDFRPGAEVTQSQSRGLFTVFIYDYINEVHPQRLPQGRQWTVEKLYFPNKNFATVDATDGQIKSTIELIYTIEYPNVRIIKVNDITGRDLQDANITLIRFLDFLNREDYTNAAVLYGGSISRLAPYGPADSSLSSLLDGYCSTTSPANKCLTFAINESRRDLITAGVYSFVLSYTLPDNTPLIMSDGRNEFSGTVALQDDGQFLVTSLPFD